jgi:glycerophosphoryl diester phosphodiesterase
VPEIQGHRGARALRPENTLPGLAHALAIGVDALEFDVTLTADGELILAHDLTVDATTARDTGPASSGDPLYPYVGKRWLALTSKQVATLDAGDRWPAAPYEATFQAMPGTGVPTLDQVGRLITESGADHVALAVELKTNPSWKDADVVRLTEGALGTLAARALTSRARILGFDWRVLRAARAADPAVPRVALLEPTTWQPGSAWLAGLDPAAYWPTPRLAAESGPFRGGFGASSPRAKGGKRGLTGSVAAAREMGAAWISPWESMVTGDLVAAAHGADMGVVAWTVNDPGRMTELIEAGVDAIVSDRPDVLREILAGRGESLPAPCVLPWADGAPPWGPRTPEPAR